MTFLLLLTTGLLTVGPHPPTTPPAQRTFAVVVGVSDYKLGLPGKGDLNYSDDDARMFNDFLRSQAGGKVPASNIRLLVDGQASRQSILRAMSVFEKAAPTDRIIFYFSGHGDAEVFLPYDASPGVVLAHQDIKDAFRKSGAGTKLLLADACMSGTMAPHVGTGTPAARPAKPIKPASPNSNVIVMMSSRAKEEPEESSNSLESSRFQHGAFTYFLVKGAEGEADKDPHDGTVTIWELHKYVSLEVQKATSKKQTPAVFGRFDKNLAFARLTP